MRLLFKLCHVTSVDALLIEKALSKERQDFEDAVQYLSSQTIDADIILTRDGRGFSEFGILHLTAEEFLDKYLESLISSI